MYGAHLTWRVGQLEGKLVQQIAPNLDQFFLCTLENPSKAFGGSNCPLSPCFLCIFSIDISLGYLQVSTGESLGFFSSAKFVKSSLILYMFAAKYFFFGITLEDWLGCSQHHFIVSSLFAFLAMLLVGSYRLLSFGSWISSIEVAYLLVLGVGCYDRRVDVRLKAWNWTDRDGMLQRSLQ
ncbi:hypothetical protein DVH24_016814 [Malus domestica]|uniref:Uncharacterized protein n=1 Tax=Malus domestica TaxID=3750 RepID=A0A498HVG7_MALDO|nr:hypothetical protein DVH24_016814 [Malus domestica]